MSIRFSRITAMTNDKAAVFLVGGIPSTQADLDPWAAFSDFIADLKENEAITAKVETFLYGEEEPFDATPEEIAYFYKRIAMNSDFIENRTEKLSETELFLWLQKQKERIAKCFQAI